MSERYRLAREAAHAAGRAEFAALARDPLFRDFVCLYVAEGHKRDRNSVSICNSDPTIMKLAAHWMLKFSARPVAYRVQYHPDHNPRELASFWAGELGIDPQIISLVPKSNSNRLSGRSRRSLYGVLTARTGDTLFRARLQGWMDCLDAEWRR